jgi:membrane associated rhomboid family serine protease
MNRSATAIKVLVIICVILFAVTFMVPGMQEKMFGTLALYYPWQENFRVWQFVTNIFMHGGFAHIFFNMYALWAFGSPLEQMWGKNRFLLFFFLSGIGAAVIYTLVNYFQFNNLYNDFISAGATSRDLYDFLAVPREDLSGFFRSLTQSGGALTRLPEDKLVDFYLLFNTPVVGASGAIYGVLVAFGMLFPNAKLFLIFLPIPIPAKYFIPALIALDLFSGVTGFSIFGGGVAHFGHVGGAIIGFLLMWYWRSKIPRTRYPGLRNQDDQHGENV